MVSAVPAAATQNVSTPNVPAPPNASVDSTAPELAAAVAGVPAAAVPLPEAVDIDVDYEGQSLCDPTPKPGTLKLAALLESTYGHTWTSIARACNSGGPSEHKEGRAVDWGMSVTNPEQKAKVDAFLTWLTSPDAAGTPYAMARRIGVMYIGWNNQIWRGYEPERGWDELKGCYTKTGANNATYCHRDHVHISLTWDGASGASSFWDGTAITVGACDRRTNPVAVPGAGNTTKSAAVLDTAAGLGTAAHRPCRVGADRWKGDARRLPLSFQPPAVPEGYVAAVRLRVERYADPAPATLVLTGSGPAVTVGPKPKLPYDVVVPVGPSGRLSVSTTAGLASVRLSARGFTKVPTASANTGAPANSAGPTKPGNTAGPSKPGNTAGPAQPNSGTPNTGKPTPPATKAKPSTNASSSANSAARPAVSLTVPTSAVAGSALAFRGAVVRAPAGAVLRRHVLLYKSWQPVGTAQAIRGSAWAMSARPNNPTTLYYRVAVMVGGKAVAWSPARTVRVLPKPTS